MVPQEYWRPPPQDSVPCDGPGKSYLGGGRGRNNTVPLFPTHSSLETPPYPDAATVHWLCYI